MLDLDRVKDFRVLVVGDGITDEYRYVKPRGKSIKANTLSVESLKRRETFHGGAWAAAGHASGICAQVDVLTGPNVMRNIYFVDETYTSKVFNVHEMHEATETPKEFDIRSYDVVIVTDFGHGTMTKTLIERVMREARYLAVNAQTNTMNYGFNLITKYRPADFVVVDELEARLAAHDKDSPIEDVILELGFKNIIVTMGANGAVGFDGAFERQAALTEQVVDTMGAGDAFLCVTAPFAAAGFSMKQLLRIGNAAGAIKVGIVGHRCSVDRETLARHLNG
jgi:sugar/nucleoside kinase (ribokinase family)